MERLQVFLCASDYSCFLIMGLNTFVFIYKCMCVCVSLYPYYVDDWI